jgi:ATP-dependent Clp protease ATP-binding subunit ClpC
MRLLEDVLAEEILSGRLREGDTATVDIDEENKVVVVPQKEKVELLPSS